MKFKNLFILVLMLIVGGKEILGAFAVDRLAGKPCCCSSNITQKSLSEKDAAHCCTNKCHCSVCIPAPFLPGTGTTVVTFDIFRVLATEAAPLPPFLFTQSTAIGTPKHYHPVLPRSFSCPLHLRI